jgi:hypothetical protein
MNLLSFGQVIESKLMVDTSTIVFKDTVLNFVFDSISHDLGDILPENNFIVKYFKFIGDEPIIIRRAWTGDPHYICEYPTEPLIPNKIYSFKVCFCHQGRQGKMIKLMGFDLNDYERITLVFKGTYLPISNVGN